MVGCKSSPAAEPPRGGPPPEVGIVTLKTESVTLRTELAGRTAASLVSELRPQVSGIIQARMFAEGAHVKAGQVLYQIDPAMYRAAFEEAKADLASVKATLESARLKDVSDWVEQYRAIWEERFGRLDVYLRELQTEQQTQRSEA